MKILGITGGIGSGKSTVLSILREKYDAFVIEADKVGHQVMEPGGPCYEPVIGLFGKEVIKDDLSIDRSKVSDVVFQVAEKRELLNGIIHPAVKRRILEMIREQEALGRKMVVVEAALLLEDNYQEFCSEVWYVCTDMETRIGRLMESRGYSRSKCLNIIRSQKEDSWYRDRTDFVLENNGSMEDLLRKIQERLDGTE